MDDDLRWFCENIRHDIDILRNAGLADVLIAAIVGNIRHQAIASENRRIEQLLAKNPPPVYGLDVFCQHLPAAKNGGVDG